MPPPVKTPPVIVKPKGSLVKSTAAAFRKNVAIDLRLYADYNHTGKIEESDANYNLRGTYPGAIIFFACRPSKKELASFKLNAEETTIVSDLHLRTMTTLKILHTKGLQKGDEVILSADSAEADKIMVFDGEKVGAAAILGKGVAIEAKLKITEAPGSSLTLAMSSVVPPSSAKEVVFLNIKVMRKGKEEFTDKCMFGIAPWLMPATHCDASEVYVVKIDHNAPFRTALKAALAGAGVPMVELVPGDSTGKQVIGNHWTQDMFELGCQVKKGAHFHVTINSANSEVRNNFAGVWEDYLDHQHGMIRQPQSGESMDSFGNLEVTPPLPKFPLGRKYFGVLDAAISSGHTIGLRPAVKKFLTATPYQPATEIPTNWLLVGHVDEFLSIVPVKGSTTDFRVLFASPKKALQLCKDLQKAGHGANNICPGKPVVGGTHFEISVDDYVANVGGLLDLNDEIETLIKTKIVDGILLSKWGIPATHFVPIATIFNGSISGPRLENCIARTGGMVNCLVLGPTSGKIIMPKPFGPVDGAGKDVFKEDAAAAVNKHTGNDAVFVDDWDAYHVLAGEVHCGTNTKRVTRSYLEKWWAPDLEIDGIKVNA